MDFSLLKLVQRGVNNDTKRFGICWDHSPKTCWITVTRHGVKNLLTNAIKFTPLGGRIEVHLHVIETQAQIVVSDTGCGIDAEFLPYVFDSFRQAKSSHSTKGLGLGLAIARYLVQLHGGTIRAESSGLGQGATFTVKLPLFGVSLWI